MFTRVIGFIVYVFYSVNGHLPFSRCTDRGGVCVPRGKCWALVEEWDHSCGPRRVCCRPLVSEGNPECGIIPVLDDDSSSTRSKRVVGGDPAVAGEWPWQVALVARGKHICGGSLITSEWVITAAHCFKKYPPRRVAVILGQHRKGRRTGNEQMRRVSKLVKHRRFSLRFSNAHDIALVKLNRPVDTSGEYIRTVCLPFNTSIVFDEYDPCYVTGWGSTKNTGDHRVLRHLQVDIVPQDVCNRTWGVIREQNICAGNGDTGACKGDSGGPLVCHKNGRYTLAGVTSWGSSSCIKSGYPDVYTRVTSFLGWIFSKIYRYGS